MNIKISRVYCGDFFGGFTVRALMHEFSIASKILAREIHLAVTQTYRRAGVVARRGQPLPFAQSFGLQLIDLRLQCFS